jgi:hypothetical protein
VFVVGPGAPGWARATVRYGYSLVETTQSK